MWRKLFSMFLALVIVGFGQPVLANDFNVSVALPSNSWKGRLHANGVLDFTFSGSATSPFSNCQTLWDSLGRRLSVKVEIAEQSLVMRLGEQATLVSAGTSSLTCQVGYGALDASVQELSPAKLSVFVDNQLRESKEFIYQSYFLPIPAPTVLSPSRGQEVTGQFSIMLDEVSGLVPYSGLIVKVCKQVCTADSPSYWLDYVDDVTGKRIRDKKLIDGGSIWRVSDWEIRVNAPSLKGLYSFEVTRKYATNCSLGLFSEANCSNSMWTSKPVSSELIVNMVSSPLNDPGKKWRTTDFANLSRNGVKISRTNTCEGDYGFIQCIVGVKSEPQIQGKIGLSMFWAADNQKPRLHKKFTFDVSSQNESFYFNPKVSNSVKKLRFFFVWDGETLAKTKPKELVIQRAKPVDIWRISVSAPRNIRWGQTMSVSVTATPALSGTCSYYIGYNLVASSKLTKGRSSARFEALFEAEIGSAKTFTVTAMCKSGTRSGTGITAVNGYR